MQMKPRRVVAKKSRIPVPNRVYLTFARATHIGSIVGEVVAALGHPNV